MMKRVPNLTVPDTQVDRSKIHPLLPVYANVETELGKTPQGVASRLGYLSREAGLDDRDMTRRYDTRVPQPLTQTPGNCLEAGLGGKGTRYPVERVPYDTKVGKQTGGLTQLSLQDMSVGPVAALREDGQGPDQTAIIAGLQRAHGNKKAARASQLSNIGIEDIAHGGDDRAEGLKAAGLRRRTMLGNFNRKARQETMARAKNSYANIISSTM